MAEQDRRYGDRDSSWMRHRMMSSVDWEINTRKMARIPDTHNCTVPTDTCGKNNRAT